MRKIPSWPFYNPEEKTSYEDWITRSIQNEWLGLVLRYDSHWGEGAKPYPFMIKCDTTLQDFQNAVELEVLNSGDDHHIFIENFKPNGMWLDIITGS